MDDLFSDSTFHEVEGTSARRGGADVGWFGLARHRRLRHAGDPDLGHHEPRRRRGAIRHHRSQGEEGVPVDQKSGLKN